MDADNFDAVVRTWGARTRRAGLRLLVGGGLVTLLARSDGQDAAAKKKRKKKKHCKSNQKKCGGKCVPLTNCCDDAECEELNGSCKIGVCRAGECIAENIPNGSFCIEPGCGPELQCTCFQGVCAE